MLHFLNGRSGGSTLTKPLAQKQVIKIVLNIIIQSTNAYILVIEENKKGT